MPGMHISCFAFDDVDGRRLSFGRRHLQDTTVICSVDDVQRGQSKMEFLDAYVVQLENTTSIETEDELEVATRHPSVMPISAPSTLASSSPSSSPSNTPDGLSLLSPSSSPTMRLDSLSPTSPTTPTVDAPQPMPIASPILRNGCTCLYIKIVGFFTFSATIVCLG